MESTTGRDLKLGAFVLSAIVLLVVGSLWIAGRSFFGPPGKHFGVLLQDSGGVQVGDRVRIAGVPVGRVTRRELRPGDEWPVRFMINVRGKIILREGASASIARTGMLGPGFLQLDPGALEGSELPEDTEVFGRRASGLEQALGSVDEIAEKVKGILDQLRDVLSDVSGDIGPMMDSAKGLLSQDNVDNVNRSLLSLRELMESSGPQVTQLMTRLDSMAASMETGIDGLPALIAKLDAVVADVQTTLGEDGERLTQVLDSARTTLVSFDEAASVVGDSRPEIEATLRDLQQTTANLKALTQTLKERPFSLIRIKPEPDRRPGDR